MAIDKGAELGVENLGSKTLTGRKFSPLNHTLALTDKLRF